MSISDAGLSLEAAARSEDDVEIYPGQQIGEFGVRVSKNLQVA